MDKELIKIIPGAEIVLRCLRLALTIVPFILLGTCWVIRQSSTIQWLSNVSVVCSGVCMIYIVLIVYMTSFTKRRIHPLIYLLAYVLLLLSSIPVLLMLLCGMDYLLYEVMGWYIFSDLDRLLLPVATFVFLSVIYWLPVFEFTKIQTKYYHYLRIKETYEK